MAAFLLEPTINGDEEFRQKHQNVIEPVRTYIGVDDNILEKRDIQESYKSHLERLGLIKSKYRIDRKTGLPQFDQQGCRRFLIDLLLPLES